MEIAYATFPQYCAQRDQQTFAHEVFRKVLTRINFGFGYFGYMLRESVNYLRLCVSQQCLEMASLAIAKWLQKL